MSDLVRVRTLIVITSNFAEPLIDTVTAIMLLWLFYKCGIFANTSGLEQLFAGSNEAQMFYSKNEMLLRDGRLSSFASLKS